MIEVKKLFNGGYFITENGKPVELTVDEIDPPGLEYSKQELAALAHDRGKQLVAVTAALELANERIEGECPKCVEAAGKYDAAISNAAELEDELITAAVRLTAVLKLLPPGVPAAIELEKIIETLGV